MSIVLNRKYIENPLEPPHEVVAFCLQQHQSSIYRMEKLANYYEGKHDVLERKTERDKEYRSNIVTNHFKLIVDSFTAFALGNPVAYTEQNQEQDISIFTDMLEKMDIVSHDIELEKDLSVFGFSNELHYMRKDMNDELETEICITKIDPRGSFVVTDDTVDKNKLFAVRYVKQHDLNGNEKGYCVEIYTKSEVITYESESLEFQNVVEISRVQHYFGEVPMVEFRNNEEKIGDAEPVLSLIDAYNNLQSDRSNDIDTQINAVLIAYGYSLVDALENAKGSTQIAIETPIENARTEFLTNSLDQTQVELFVKSIEENIHKISYVPNMNDEKFSGNVSGEAMKWKVFMMLNALVIKQRYFIKGIKERLILLQNVLNVKNGINLNLSTLKIQMKPNLPVNLSEIIQNINNSQEFIPLIHSLGWLPDVDNPQELIEQLNEQKMNNMERQMELIGSSHDDIEKDEEDDSDSENSKDNQSKRTRSTVTVQ
ncbi:phage portal protein, SPP1 family [Pilibacter termitis]|uniref:Phage portal protein, SPP1 family n=1 Tax=Pilibacter termitis TaxID=263852 RepID=A0A1T4REA5_9ENTE|nr:phage portal protein [Pilibacter termitis]SKA13951.1 phage portal protein, SPP1 family [Pilibacter termitis]